MITRHHWRERSQRHQTIIFHWIALWEEPRNRLSHTLPQRSPRREVAFQIHRLFSRLATASRTFAISGFCSCPSIACRIEDVAERINSLPELRTPRSCQPKYKEEPQNKADRHQSLLQLANALSEPREFYERRTPTCC